MSSKKIIFLIGLSMVCCSLWAQSDWFVDQQNGDDSNSGLSLSDAFQSVSEAESNVQPGDTIWLIGEFRNASFGDGDPWNSDNTIKFNNLHGSDSTGYITIKAVDSSTVLYGDASSLFRITNSSYLRVEGLRMEGEVARIPLDTALAYQFAYLDTAGALQYRVQPGTPDSVVDTMTFPLLSGISRSTWMDTKGIYVSNSHHIHLLNNVIGYMPGTGLRVAGCDYVDIIGNEVHNSSRRSYAGTHALVVHSSESIDSSTDYKIRIEGNSVHHNYNELYSWSPSKTIITPELDEGKGISLQKNSVANGWHSGRFLVQNNLCYFNGFSGVHNNSGDRIDVHHNSCYLNSYSGRGNNIGISTAGGSDFNVRNNLVVADSNWGGFALSLANTTQSSWQNNLFQGRLDPDVDAIDQFSNMGIPGWSNIASFDFNLDSSSVAINAADPAYSPATDFFGEIRDSLPDIGAVEYKAEPLVIGLEDPTQLPMNVYPLPFTEVLKANSSSEPVLYDIRGSRVQADAKQLDAHWELNTGQLPAGTYLLIGGKRAQLVQRK